MIWRSQLRYVQATDDPSPQDREVRALLQPQTLVYGLTPRLTAFSTLPILTRRWIESDADGVKRDSAVGDLKVVGRFTFFADDYAPLSTRRVALIGGLKFPTGSDRFGTPSFDPILGAVGTWAANRHELDADLLYTIGTKRHDFETGDRIQYDLAYRYRLWPKRFGRRLEDRYGNRSTILTSQLPSESWHDHVGDPTIADAICDRLLHNAHKIALQGESRRKDKNKRS